jgi:hypothetical protein
MVMVKPDNIHGSGGVASDEERQPLRGGGSLETERASTPSAPQGVEQKQGSGGGRLRRACVRGGLVLCLLTVPAVLLLLQWRAASSSQWVFEFAEPLAEDDEQGKHLLPFPVHFCSVSVFFETTKISVHTLTRLHLHNSVAKKQRLVQTAVIVDYGH